MSSGTVLFRQHASLALPASGSTSIQNQVDGLVSNFVKEASDPSTLSSILAGSLAYRFGKLGVLSLGSSSVLRPLSLVASLGSEVTAYEFTNRALQTFAGGGTSHLQNAWSWSGPGGWKQGLASSAITFGLLRGVGSLAREQNLILQHFLQSTAMVAGHQMAGHLGVLPKPEGNLSEQLLHAEVLNLQLSAGMGLAHALTPGLSASERVLDWRLEQKYITPTDLIRHDPLGLQPLLAVATSTSAASLGETKEKISVDSPKDIDPSRAIFTLPMSGDFTTEGGTTSLPEKYRIPTPLLPSEQAALTKKWGRYFPDPQQPQIYSKEIIGNVLKIRSSIPNFHEKILNALSTSPQAGGAPQFFIAEGLKWLFNFNALASSTGSFDHVILQHLVQEAVSDPEPSRGHEALKTLFEKMAEAPSSSDFLEIIRKNGYAKDLRVSDQKPEYSYEFWVHHHDLVSRKWEGYSHHEMIFLFNYVSRASGENSIIATKMIRLLEKARVEQSYEGLNYERALNFARQHPLGFLVMERIFHALLIEDHPSKLKELQETSLQPELFQHVDSRIREGASQEDLAHEFNETAYTAHVDDRELARKVVSVAAEAALYVLVPAAAQRAQSEFTDVFFQEMQRHQPVTLKQLINLLGVNPTPHSLQVVMALKNGELQIQLVSPELIAEKAKEMGEVEGCISLFIKGFRGEPDLLLLTEIPPLSMTTLPEKNFAYSRVGNMASFLIHEGEHSRHARGREVSRHNRIVSEMMAELEQFNWDIRNFSTNTNEMAARLGQNLPGFLRAMGESNYYRLTNERLVREFFRP